MKNVYKPIARKRSLGFFSEDVVPFSLSSKSFILPENSSSTLPLR